MEKIVCKYIFDKNYNPKYANGAYGGINSLGEIVIHFYLERTALPNSQTLEVKNGLPTNNILESNPIDLPNSFVRFIDTGVVVNYNTAKEIHRFLGEHLKTIEGVLNINKTEI